MHTDTRSHQTYPDRNNTFGFAVLADMLSRFKFSLNLYLSGGFFGVNLAPVSQCENAL